MTSSLLGSRRSTLVSAVALCALAGAAATWVYLEVSRARGPVSWDEGNYVWHAHRIAVASREDGLGAAWRAAANGEILYPPLHGVLLGVAFLLFGESEAVAYALTALALALCGALIWKAGDQLGGPVAGSIAVLLLLTSRLHLEFTATAMLEVPGTAVTLLGAWLHLRYLRAPRARAAWLSGLGLVAVFFFKYNYGLLLAAGVFASELLRRPFRPWSAQCRGLWLPLPLTAAAWFTLPWKLHGFLTFARNRDSGMMFGESVLYYARALTHSFAAGVFPAVITGAGAVVAAIALWRRAEVRFLTVFAVFGFVGMILHPYKLERSVATVVPALWLLCGVAGSRLLRTASESWPRWKMPIAGAMGVVLLAPLPVLYGRDLPAIVRHLERGEPHPWSHFPWPKQDLLEPQKFIVDGVNPDLPTCVAGEFAHLSPLGVRWKLATRYPHMPVVDRCFSEAVDWSFPANLVTIEVLPTSAYYIEDYLTFNAGALKPIHALEQRGFVPYAQSTFARSGVQVKIYQVDRPPL